jgi:hypothetical protein
MASLCELYGVPGLTKGQWLQALQKAIDVQEYICRQVRLSRKKDFDNPVVQAMFLAKTNDRGIGKMEITFSSKFLQTEAFRHAVEK